MPGRVVSHGLRVNVSTLFLHVGKINRYLKKSKEATRHEKVEKPFGHTAGPF